MRIAIIAIATLGGMFCGGPFSSSAVGQEADWSTAFRFRTSGGFENPGVIAAFNPQPEPPAYFIPPEIDLSEATELRMTIPDIAVSEGGAQILMALPDEFSFEADGAPNGEAFFFQANGPSPLNMQFTMTTGSGGFAAPGTWVAFNPQPEPPAGFHGIGFEFQFTSNSPATLVIEILDDGVEPLAFELLQGADFDSDSDVDSADLAAWQAAYGGASGGDANLNGQTNGEDFLLWQQQNTTGQEIVAVPEPAGMAILVGGLLLILRIKRRTVFLVCMLLPLTWCASSAQAVDKFWDGSASDFWSNASNWTPFGVPAQNDNAILNNTTFGSAVFLAGNARIRGLQISNGIDVNTNGHQLSAAGGGGNPTIISNPGSSLTLRHAANAPTAFFTHRFELVNGGDLFLGALGQLGAEVEIGEPGSTIDVGSVISGAGFIGFDNFGGGSTTSVLNNNGTVRANFGTLTISTDGAFDLDGTNGNGVVDVDDGTFLSTSLRLNVNGPLTDPFDGTMQIGRGDTVSFSDSWQLGANAQAGSGLLEMNGLSDTATLRGGDVTVRGNATQINVLSGNAVFFPDFDIDQATMTISPNTSVDFRGDMDFRSGSKFNLGSGSTMAINGTTVFRQSTVNWDGPVENSQTTIGPTGILEFQTNSIEAIGNQFDGSVSVHGGVLSVQTSGAWVMNGNLNLNNVNDSIGRVSGQPFIVGNGVDTGPDGAVNVGGIGETRITAQTTFRSDAELTINARALLRINNNVTIETGAEVFGSGTLLNDGNLLIQNGVTIPGKLQNIDRLTLSGPTTFSEVTVGEYEQSAQFSRMTVDIGDAATNMFDRLTVVGDAILGGILDVDLASLTEPVLGDQFPLITANSISGTFHSLQLPPLSSGDVWNIKYNPSSVILEVVAPLLADFDNDGDVDGLDFLALQRDNPALIPNWQTEYGNGSVVAASANVPEPSTVCLLLLTGLFLTSPRRRIL
ncbi:autotransporter outer membrane beta-barrel domain-containing protein [Adhaeretor mobilis]|uniref:PEP-CTERM protein-sorting domain-containing protein n=1 Tax=Adhaeretor mobilis TaxID=1930276 RepID=A0A517N378_9BACT|nr:hypothetical protein [Adhaeretor mobilis]QDT01583.1 hypothetical protein HG15A2_49300 [Adhaeretor mobilis]